MNTDHVQEVYPMWEGFYCRKCDQRVKGRKMWQCVLMLETAGGAERETKYICQECAATKEDAVNFFLGDPQ